MKVNLPDNRYISFHNDNQSQLTIKHNLGKDISIKVENESAQKPVQEEKQEQPTAFVCVGC